MRTTTSAFFKGATFLTMLCLACACAVSCSGGGTAGTGGQIFTGRLSTPQTLPLAGVVITILESGDSGQTDANGNFAIDAATSGGDINMVFERSDINASLKLDQIPSDAAEVDLDLEYNQTVNQVTPRRVEVKTRPRSSSTSQVSSTAVSNSTSTDSANATSSSESSISENTGAASSGSDRSNSAEVSSSRSASTSSRNSASDSSKNHDDDDDDTSASSHSSRSSRSRSLSELSVKNNLSASQSFLAQIPAKNMPY